MRYHVLDGLRGIAAIAVVTAHADKYFGRWTFGDSGLAVDLFFCLSGFVIPAAYADRLATTGVGRFMALRYIRLYPLYLVGTGIGVAVQLLDPDPSVPLGRAIVFSLLLLPTPAALTAAVFPLNFPGWSLVLELAVNFLWSLFRFEPKAWLVALSVLGSLSLMVAAALLSRQHTFELGFQLNQLPFGMARAVFSFTIGVLLYRHLEDRRAMRKSTGLSLLMLGLVGFVFVPDLEGTARFAYDLAIVALVFPAVVYVAAQLQPGRRVTRLCMLLGSLSYGVYAIHDPLSDLVEASGVDVARYAPWSGVALVMCVGGLVYALDRFYDMPLRRRLVGLLASHASRSPAVERRDAA